jgi:hypothetical protein
VRATALLLLAGCSFPHGSLSTDAPPASADDANRDAMPDGKPDAADACPAGFTSLANAPTTSKYKAFSAQSFTAAVNACNSLGTHLVHLDTQGEVDAIYTLIDSVTGVGDTHLYRVVGQRDKSVTPNRWLDLSGNALTFLPWGATEPTNGLNEDCIMMRLETAATNKVIGADQCTTNHEYACECE